MTNPVTHVWKPSAARLVTIDSFVPVPRGSIATAPAPLNWPAKDPQDVLDYQLDIGPAVIGNAGDTITAMNVTVTPSSPGDLVINSVSADGTLAVLWLAGGQAGVVYTITCTISMTSGRTIQRSLLLPVMSLSVPAIPVNAIQTSAGVVLTDQNGNPVTASP